MKPKLFTGTYMNESEIYWSRAAEAHIIVLALAKDVQAELALAAYSISKKLNLFASTRFSGGNRAFAPASTRFASKRSAM